MKNIVRQKKSGFIKFSFDKKYFYSIKKSSFDKKNNTFFREYHMVSLGLIAELESLRDAAITESTSQRLSSQVGQVVNRARDIMRYISFTFSRNASTSFRAESTLHSSFPKILRLARASRYRNVLPKEVCKKVVHMEKTVFKWNPLTHDEIICFAEVNFL